MDPITKTKTTIKTECFLIIFVKIDDKACEAVDLKFWQINTNFKSKLKLVTNQHSTKTNYGISCF